MQELDRPSQSGLSAATIPIAHCCDPEFMDRFRADLANAETAVTILSPFLSPNRAVHYYPSLAALTVRQARVEVYVRPRHEQPESLRDRYPEVERALTRAGATVHLRPGMHEKVAAIDGRILWHGSLNILSHNDTRESMLRFESPELVREVLTDLGLGGYPVESRPEPDRSGILESSPAGERPCPACGHSMILYPDAGLWICSGSPACGGTMLVDTPPEPSGAREWRARSAESRWSCARWCSLLLLARRRPAGSPSTGGCLRVLSES
jgi:hypothetical protein